MAIWRRQPEPRLFHHDRNQRFSPAHISTINQHDSCTLFVDNLPRGTGRWELKTIFRSFGVLARVYVADRRKTNDGFAFINFYSSRARMQLLQSSSAISFKGRMLFIGVAARSSMKQRRGSYDERRSYSLKGWDLNGAEKEYHHAYSPRMNHSNWPKQRTVRQEWRRKEKNVERDTMHGQGRRTITLDEVPANVDGLKLSLVLRTEVSRSYNDVLEVLARELNHPFRVIVLNHFTFVICFETEQHREEAGQQLQKLMPYFVSFEPWRMFDRYDRRRVWIALKGIPPQAWSKENVVKLASLFGEVIDVDGWSVEGVAMEEARVRVLTKDMSFISEELVVNVGSLGVTVCATECYHLGSDSWSVKYGHAARMVSSFGDQNNDNGHAGLERGSIVPESNDQREANRGESHQHSGSVSGQKTNTAQVAYDLANEEHIVNTQVRASEEVNSSATMPPGFEGALNSQVNEVNIQISNLVAAPINALNAPTAAISLSSDSNIADQAIALVRLLDGHVEDEGLAKEAIVAQRRSQRLAKKSLTLGV